MFIVFVWDDNYIAQFPVPSPVDATRKARELFNEGRQNVFVRDPDRNEYRAEEFEALQLPQLRKVG